MKKRQIISCVAALLTAFSAVNPTVMNAEETGIKNIIYMIPDGGGMDPFYLSDALKQAGGWDREIYPNSTETETGEMYIKPYLVGAITTRSADSSITDSAAAGTALSSGYKTKNGYIGVDPDKKPHANILEAAQYAGKNVGLVSTYEWTNATPASFSAHDKERGNYEPMSEQIVNQGIDVVLGAGFGAAKWGSLAEAEIRGYDIIDNREELAAVEPGDKIWGNLVSSNFPYDIEKGEEIANIAEMTKAAVTALADDNENGFFLMVEGSKVDGGGHSNDALGMVGEFLAFDEACKVAIEFAKDREDTLVVIAPDHDTGGMVLPEDLEKAAEELKSGNQPSELTWETTGHTARNGGLFMYIPEGEKYPEGISGKNIGEHKAYEENVIDNIAIAQYLADIIGVDMDELTKELFVDVTEMGSYDSESQLFRFNDYPITVKRNASYAFVDDSVVSIDGQVAICIDDNFYVPQMLLDIAEGKVQGESYDIAYPLTSTVGVYMPDSSDVTKWVCKIGVTNFLPKKEITGKLQFKSPENFAALEPIDIGVVEGGKQKIIEFDCPNIDLANTNFDYEYEIVTEDGKAYNFAGIARGFAYAGYAKEPITVDGIIDEDVWNDSVKLTCDKASQIVMIEDWKGARDLSATFSMLWDEEYFYMYAVVTDEIFCQKNTPDSLWRGDSVQFGIFNDTEGVLVNAEAGTVYEEIGIAYINEEPTAYRFISQSGKTEKGIIERGEGFDMACVREGDDLTYELKFKWSELVGYDFKPTFGSVLGFSALINDDDGGGRRGWIEYGSGIGMTKNVNDFVSMPMLDLSDLNSDEIKLVFNGKRLMSDVAPVIVENRTLVPVRTIFEAIGAEVEWDAENRIVTSKLGDKTVTLKIGEAVINVDGEEKAIDVPAQIMSDRTMIPLRAVSEAYGCEVEWQESTRTVRIN